MNFKNMWHIWCDALGQKANTENNTHSDNVAIVRTIIILTYLITNIVIVAGVIRHW